MGSHLIAEILRPDGARLKQAYAKIREVKHLASYNWLERQKPTIAVPGSPRLWAPPKFPKRVPKDTGRVFISQNAARHPQSPLEPLFRALLLAQPAFDFRDVDLVTDRNNIRKLLTFVNPKLDKYPIKPFTINVEVCHNTVLFDRVVPTPETIVRPNQFVGYGHNLEEAFTANRVDGSTGHHRVVSYTFNGLNLIVRHETDAFRSPGPAPAHTPVTDPPPRPRPAAPGSALMVTEAGSEVPLEWTMELKTHGASNPIDLNHVIPQLWVSQTPNLVLAFHRDGRFRVPPTDRVTNKISKWQKENYNDLRALGELIKRIISVVKESGGSALVEHDGYSDNLAVWGRDGSKMLPEDLYFRMAEGDGNPSSPGN